jgi:hypothetical protein
MPNGAKAIMTSWMCLMPSEMPIIDSLQPFSEASYPSPSHQHL